MTVARKPLFYERRTYRRRRMADAARLLPFLGFALFSLPLLWREGDGAAARTSEVMLYVFLVWAALGILAWLISRRLQPERSGAAPPDAR